MSLVIAQINIDDSSDKTITGVWIWDRDCGGTLVAPSGSAFPSSPVAGEIFWNIPYSTIYRRDNSNSFWESIGAPPSGPAGGDLDGYFPNPTVVNMHLPGQSNGALAYYNGSSWLPLAAPAQDGYMLSYNTATNSLVWTSHDALRRLIHLADSGGPFEGYPSGTYREITPSGSPFPTSVVWYISSDKTQKIIEKTLVLNSQKMPTTITWKVYDLDGITVLHTVTDTLTYSISGVFELNRTRTII
jgi:hypothetical protein